ncbi:hypothetical protein BACCAP_00019 [Pseudoflavonifractor capillosus ATCC 29799]|uniref:Uncharacterized protein n=1 Tax=Pseudoflavonifractor capillosus ATCC 29799 TaxID=411467 RepID=A6NP87_9FIRM|nr:hypothetical protein BACCAP_00019 [Pseudoflavonifractor capillosus ATCC 29799]
MSTATKFQSTLPVWGATAFSLSWSWWLSYFNPRSPCGERQAARLQRVLRRYFNPRSPCGERLICWLMLDSSFRFQSTLPVWGATYRAPASIMADSTQFQSTLPVWGATSWRRIMLQFGYNFNPRSPCGERHVPGAFWPTSKNFNPRSPCGERPGELLLSPSRHYFNPRSPCGERR